MSSRIDGVATWILKVAAVAVAAALFYFAVGYEERTGSVSQVFAYFLLPVAVLTSLIAVLRSRAEVRANGALLVVSVGVSLYAVEAGLQYKDATWTSFRFL